MAKTPKKFARNFAQMKSARRPSKGRKGPSTPPRFAIAVQYGTVSTSFSADVQTVLAKMSVRATALAKEYGISIWAGQRVTDRFPHLKGIYPRGWYPGATWDDADGVYDTSTRIAAVAEGPLAGSSSSERRRGVLAHEFGHALDDASAIFSSRNEFKVAYKRDVDGMTQSERDQLGYYLQPGAAGRSEAFAEAFAHVIGEAAGWYQKREFATGFTQVIALVRKEFG